MAAGVEVSAAIRQDEGPEYRATMCSLQLYPMPLVIWWPEPTWDTLGAPASRCALRAQVRACIHHCRCSSAPQGATLTPAKNPEATPQIRTAPCVGHFCFHTPFSFCRPWRPGAPKPESVVARWSSHELKCDSVIFSRLSAHSESKHGWPTRPAGLLGAPDRSDASCKEAFCFCPAFQSLNV